MAAGMVVLGKLLYAGPRPSPPTPPTPPPWISEAGLPAICACSDGLLVLAPFCAGATSLMKTWRVTVFPLREAMTLTSPPVVPVGENFAELDGPVAMVPIEPWSTLQVTLVGLPFS